MPISKTPFDSKLTGVPLIVTPGPPAVIVVPSIEKAVGFAVKTCPSTVKISAGVIAAEPIISVLLPTTTKPLAAPAGASEMGVPETVMIPPGVRVWPSMIKSEEASAVYVWPSKVITGASVMIAEALPRDWVLLPMTAKAGAVPAASEIGVPDTVIEPPGVSVCPPMMNWAAAFAVYVEPSNVRTAGALAILGAEPRDCVLPPTTAYALEAPAGASEIGVPDTVICPPGVSVWPATMN